MRNDMGSFRVLLQLRSWAMQVMVAYFETNPDDSPQKFADFPLSSWIESAALKDILSQILWIK